MKRLLRIVLLGGLLVAVVAAIRALRGGPSPGLAGAGHASPTAAPEPAVPPGPPTPHPLDDGEALPPDAVEPLDREGAGDDDGEGGGSSPLQATMTTTVVLEGGAVAELAEPGGDALPMVKTGEAAATWMPPLDDGTCPVTHPIKGKASSGIFHVPGGRFYDRTRPDRCYVSADAAVADGLRPAKA